MVWGMVYLYIIGKQYLSNSSVLCCVQDNLISILNKLDKDANTKMYCRNNFFEQIFIKGITASQTMDKMF